MQNGVKRRTSPTTRSIESADDATVCCRLRLNPHLLPSKPVPTIECRVTARSAVFASPTIEWRLTRPTRLTVADRNTKKKTANRANRSESIREDSRDSSFFRLLYRPVTFNLMALNHYPAAYSAANFSTNSVYSPSSELQEIDPPPIPSMLRLQNGRPSPVPRFLPEVTKILKIFSNWSLGMPGP